MADSDDNKINLPDFSVLQAVSTSIKQMVSSFAETAIKIQAILQPILDTAAAFQVRINKVIIQLGRAARPLLVIQKLGDAQFVCWSYMSDEFIEAIIASNNVNKTLREIMIKDKFQTVDETIDKCLNNAHMSKHKRLLAQSVAAYKSGQCELAVIGFTSIIDGLLTIVSGNATTRIVTRTSAILEKVENNEDVESSDYALLTLMVTFQKTMDSFAANSEFKKKEPKGLNRHWIAHGRSCRRRTKLDCVKLINTIYGILLIDELGKSQANV